MKTGMLPIELNLARDQLRSRNLRVHATLLTYGLARSIASSVLIGEEEVLSPIVKRLILSDADEVLNWFHGLPLTDRDLCIVGMNAFAILSTSGRLFHWLELVSLALLTSPDEQRILKAREFIGYCLGLGCIRRPLGDRFAISVLLVAVVGGAIGAEVSAWLLEMTSWVCDRYEDDELGLAEPRAETLQELKHAVGSMLESAPAKRKESTLAAAILDACSLLGLNQVYNDAHNDFLAVDAIPFVFVPGQGPEQYYVGPGSVFQTFRGNYSTEWSGQEGWKNAKTHYRADVARRVDEAGHSWLAVATSLLLRDRWWLRSINACLDNLRSTVESIGVSGGV